MSDYEVALQELLLEYYEVEWYESIDEYYDEQILLLKEVYNVD